MIRYSLVKSSMKHSGIGDYQFISSSQIWKEENNRTMITPISCCQEDEAEEEEENRSVWTPRRGGGEKKEEGLLKTMMITRPKGGKGYLCMDSEEMKACKDLGFEFEEDKLKFEFDTITISSVPCSPTSISNPGDDPREVKARLKLWAQAVAQASSHRRVRG